MKPPTKIAAGMPEIFRVLTKRHGKPMEVSRGPKPVREFELTPDGYRETTAATLKSRAKNPEKYREYQREYMRKRRAKETK